MIGPNYNNCEHPDVLLVYFQKL